MSKVQLSMAHCFFEFIKFKISYLFKSYICQCVQNTLYPVYVFIVSVKKFAQIKLDLETNYDQKDPEIIKMN